MESSSSPSDQRGAARSTTGHFDTFRTCFDTPVLGAIPVTFRLNAAAKVDEVLVDIVGPITFKRKPEARPGSSP